MKKSTVRKFRTDLRMLEQIIVRQLKSDTLCHGVSVAQCHLLLAIESAGASSLKKLVDCMHLDKSTLSRTVEGLVKTGLLKREISDQDRRITLLSLTPQGQLVCDGINKANDQRYEKILKEMGRDNKIFAAMFSDFVKTMVKQPEQESSSTLRYNIKDGCHE